MQIWKKILRSIQYPDNIPRKKRQNTELPNTRVAKWNNNKNKGDNEKHRKNFSQ